MDLPAILKDSAARLADKTAIIMGERKVSFADLEKDSNRVAHALLKMGVKNGDRVAMMQASNPEFAAVFFGIIKAGAIAVPLDSRYVAGELSSLFNDCTPKVFFIEGPCLEPLLPALPGFTSIEHIIAVNYQPDERFIGYEDILK
jgi:long-chain acyl-CoA synthetase